MLGRYQTTWRDITENLDLDIHRRENRRSDNLRKMKVDLLRATQRPVHCRQRMVRGTIFSCQQVVELLLHASVFGVLKLVLLLKNRTIAAITPLLFES